MTASEIIRNFALYHAVGDLPYSTLTVEALKEAINLLELKEQNRIIELPVPIGTEVYVIWEEEICSEDWCGDAGAYCEEKCPCFSIKYHISKRQFNKYDYDRFGEIVFATREEAEARLKELKNEKERSS